jgi:hypothetical protein
MPEDSPSSYADAKERQQQPGAYYPGYGYYYQSQGANAGPATYQYPAGQYPAVQYPTGTSTTVQDQLHLYSGGN